MVRIIGDVHGKIDEYKKITEDCTPALGSLRDYSIQLGDIGFKKQWDRVVSEIPGEKHKIIAGNHDDYDTLIYAENYLGDFGGDLSTFDVSFFFVRGAYSLDSKIRTANIDIWPEKEEISYSKLDMAIRIYEKIKPNIVLTHDAPKLATMEIFNPDYHYPSRTVEALDQMLEIHQPKLWIFGHWHITSYKKINDTMFICLGELEFIDYDETKDVSENVNLITEQLKRKR